MKYLFLLPFLITQVHALDFSTCELPSLLDPKIEKLFTGLNSCRFFTRHGFDSRSPIQSVAFGNLTPYWAQELSGLDLSKSFLEQYQKEQKINNTPMLQEVRIGIMDEGLDLSNIPQDKIQSDYLKSCAKNYDREKCDGLEDYSDHGTAVTNLMIGPPPIGTTLHSKLSCAIPLMSKESLDLTNTSTDFAKNNSIKMIKVEKIETAKKKCIDSNDQKSDIINFSFYYGENTFDGEERKYLETLKDISQKSILVMAAGNDFPKEINSVMKSLSGIRVGAMDPNGVHSSYSQSDNEVDICAPSAEEIQTKTTVSNLDGTKDKKLKSFSGTSGAAPLVTAALANVSELLPGIKVEEARALLKKCAYKSAGFDGSASGNGAGALNSYKMIEVAKRLRAEKKPAWPENRQSIFQDDLYDFQESGQNHYLEAMKLIQKQKEKNKYTVDCPSQELIYNHLRKAVFLNPENTKAANELAKLYQINGFDSQADYFKVKNPREVYKNEVARLLKQKAPSKQFRDLALGASRYGISPYELGSLFIKQLVQNESEEELFSLNQKGSTIAKLTLNLPMAESTKLFLDTVKFMKNSTSAEGNFYNLIYEINHNFEKLKKPKKSFELIDSLYQKSPEGRTPLVQFFTEKMKDNDFPDEKKLFMEKVAKEGNGQVLSILYKGLYYYCLPKTIVSEFIKSHPPKNSEELEKIQSCLTK